MIVFKEKTKKRILSELDKVAPTEWEKIERGYALEQRSKDGELERIAFCVFHGFVTITAVNDKNNKLALYFRKNDLLYKKAIAIFEKIQAPDKLRLLAFKSRAVRNREK